MIGNLPPIVSADEWLTARKEFLAKEKAATKARDALNAERRMLPMMRVEKPYEFHGPGGTKSLVQLFEGRPQLIVRHFMFAPEWDTACPSCSSAADGISGLRQLHARNTSLVAVSRAPYEKIAAYEQRMGWTFPWYSSFGGDFNYDYHATLDDRVAPVLLHFKNQTELESKGTPWDGKPWDESMRGTEMPGISVFANIDGEVFLTYSTFGRGIEEFHHGYPYLDLTLMGRQEGWEEPRGRATPLGRQAGGPNLRLPDEYASYVHNDGPGGSCH